MIKQPIRTFILFLLFLFVSLISGAQISNEFRYYYPEFEEGRTHQLLLHLANINFVKDNEYKNKFAWGHTLIGYGIQPTLMYYAGERLRLRAGVFLQQYSGLNYYSEIRPILSVHLRVSPSFDLIMGTLKGHVHHDVIEPLFDTERQYTRPVENGIQFLINRPWMDMDVWVDWEQYVQEGDDFPEWFTAGMSTTLHLKDTADNKWQLSLPLHMMAVHRGGEVSTYVERVQTSMNLAAGVRLNRELQGAFEDVGLFAYAMNYNNLNDVGQLGVNNGYAWYAGVTANTRRTNLMAGYFYGHDFVALRGGGIFQSVSPIRNNVYVPTRQLITMKIGYNRMFLKKIKFSFLFEGYYDIPDARFDFAPGIQLVFSPSFFLTEAEFF
ncbi:hypothetical protein [Marinilabilia salmonicolor]|uniref:Uncharacterized protein n=1 Tax=Marinilabilia salmonicolor TaxID=989 RepID=A0A368UUA8_9BACT|nr:hypothetical protein [Marinilabilia salmonicolor]RCW31630.1 hypothetical protein DFO77_11776 [Marinilabilia salmonicolor]